jgi:hypothetical protein
LAEEVMDVLIGEGMLKSLINERNQRKDGRRKMIGIFNDIK